MNEGCLGGSAVEYLPSAQGVIPGSGIESHIGLTTGSLLLPLPVSLPLSPSLMNKEINKIFQKNQTDALFSRKFSIKLILNSMFHKKQA